MMDFVADILRGRMLTVVFLLLLGRVTCGITSPATADSTGHSVHKVENAESGNRGIPEWFIPGAVYSDESGMLYIQTDSACMTLAQAEESLGRESVRSVNTVLDEWFGTGAGERMDLTKGDLFENFLFQGRKEIRIDGDLELAQMSKVHNGPDSREYYCGFAQLHLDEEFRKFAKIRWQTVQTTDRLVRSGLVGGSLLALLAIAFGYLKMETATRGFYSRRLQTATVIGILLIMAVAFWFQQTLLSP